ncbi:DUF5392 family protein [Sulfurimonas sp.]|uniref:DUF5392 family protein n=1 Tax=Sulfurimonas sp. TaxID=2022749 RepID=UPI0025DC8099|nr:DUF5392 family protein [Sulfurimonas sp.]
MADVKGNDNYTIDGNNSHIGDKIHNIDTINIINVKNENKDVVKQRRIEPFFKIGLIKTPFFNQFFFYSFVVISLSLLTIFNMFRFSFAMIFPIYLALLIGAYWLHGKLYIRFFDMVYIKEDEVTKGDISYLYEKINPDSIEVDNSGKIHFGFVDSTENKSFDMKSNAASLLKYKIKEYHKYKKKEE